jgi:hypothetical protein
MLFDAHNHAFRVFGGIRGRDLYDNIKTAIELCPSQTGWGWSTHAGLDAIIRYHLARSAVL